MSLLSVGLPMVGVWCNVRVLLCLMVVRAAIACYTSSVVVDVIVCCCVLWFDVVVLCSDCVGCFLSSHV